MSPCCNAIEKQANPDRQENQSVNRSKSESLPFEHLKKDKRLIELIKKLPKAIVGFDLILAGIPIKELEIEGLKLDLRG